jgi:endonuclease/exonuclease/phosphatase family metal-dependent hydrolase
MESADDRGPALSEFQRSLALDRVYKKQPAGWKPTAQLASRLRVLSWNIERGHDPGGLAKTIRSIRPDIACLQEVDWGNQRTDLRDVAQLLAEETGMLALFGIEFIELSSPERNPKIAGGGATGNVVLCRMDPVTSFRIELDVPLDWEKGGIDPSLPPRVRGWLRREPRIGRRFGLGVEFAVGGRRLVICSVHFEDKFGGISGRFRQFQTAASALGKHGDEAATLVVAGDFNTFDSRLARLRTFDTNATALGRPNGVPEAEWWRRKLLPLTGFADPFGTQDWTFRVPPFFRAKLDWIAIRNGIAHEHGVGPFASSDHRLVWVDIEMTME